MRNEVVRRPTARALLSHCNLDARRAPTRLDATPTSSGTDLHGHRHLRRVSARTIRRHRADVWFWSRRWRVRSIRGSSRHPPQPHKRDDKPDSPNRHHQFAEVCPPECHCPDAQEKEDDLTHHPGKLVGKFRLSPTHGGTLSRTGSHGHVPVIGISARYRRHESDSGSYPFTTFPSRSRMTSTPRTFPSPPS